MKKLIIYILFLLTGILQITAVQGQTLRGVITDRSTRETLPGANIMVQGTTIGTVTDFNGRYSLDLSAGTHTVVFRFIGYAPEEISITLAEGETRTLNVELYPDITTFEEFVVVGYGTQQKKVITGAISSVGSEEITSTPILRIEQAMQGRTAGVMVTNQSGQPGEAPTVRVRGVGTTGNASPLYIVDGMAVDGIDFLNPGDIESVDVLKDAASAAIYGARAANGVILITTKQGTPGRINMTFSSYQGVQNAARTIEMMNADQYRMLMNEGARNAGQTEPFDLSEVAPHNTNWQDALFQTNAPIFNHEVSVAGGTERSTFSSSMSYFSQQGIIGGDKSQYDRITARLNTRHKVNDFITFGNNLSYSHITTRGIASNSSFNSAYSSALNLDPLTPVYEENDNKLNQMPYANYPVVTNSQGRVYGISERIGAEIVNPLALMEIQTGETRVDKIVGSIFGEVEPISGFKLNTNLGIDLAYVLGDSYRPLFYLNDAQLNTEKTDVSKNINRNYTWQWENTASYTRRIGDHNVSALAGTTARKFNFENLFGFNQQVTINDPRRAYLNLATDTTWNAFGGAAHNSLASIFGRILYDYKSRYAFNATLRRDGSSRFGENNRYGVFPSLGVSWMISDENFFPSLGQLEVVKFRASWGLNGNENIGNYRFISTIDQSRGYIFGSGRAFGSSPGFVENADIGWEESEQLNIAMDFGAFNNRLTASVDYYVKTTHGLLEIIPIPAHVGNNPPVSNVGSVENRGWETTLSWRQISRNVSYSFGVNASYNQNKMTHIGNEEGVLPGATWAVAGLVTRAEIGRPIGYFWGYQTDGIFQNQTEIFQHIGRTGQVLQPNARPGDVRFVDVNGDGRISDDDRTMIGNPIPAWTFGANGSLEFRQFDLGFLITGTYGNDIFNGMQRRDLVNVNRPVSYLDRWTGEGTSNTVPRYTFSDVNNNERISDLYIEDGSYVRLKNLQIGYTLPRNVINRIRVEGWRIYVSAENLITLTNYTGADPEIGAQSSFDIGIDRGIYPQARTFRLGTSISF
jgi:TonB-dependent starch-binding outer membrane protein SusC